MRQRIFAGIILSLTAATLMPVAANGATFIVPPGSALRLDFDFSALTPAPPYSDAWAELNFCCNEANTYGGFAPGEYFSLQTFNATGTEASEPALYDGGGNGIGSGIFFTIFGPTHLTDPIGYFLVTSPFLFELNTDPTALHGTTGADLQACSRDCTPLVPATNITIVPAPVPIPAAVWLLGSALGVLGWCHRMRAK